MTTTTFTRKKNYHFPESVGPGFLKGAADLCYPNNKMEQLKLCMNWCFNATKCAKTSLIKGIQISSDLRSNRPKTEDKQVRMANYLFAYGSR